MLNKTLLNFSSLRLDTAEANFRIDGNKVVFPRVKLLGPRTLIDARGEYMLDTRTLDFNACIFPLQESKAVLADALGALLAPLSSVLELRLTGPLEKPVWSFTFGPTNLLRTITRPINSEPSGTIELPPPLTGPSLTPLDSLP